MIRLATESLQSLEEHHCPTSVNPFSYDYSEGPKSERNNTIEIRTNLMVVNAVRLMEIIQIPVTIKRILDT